MSQHDVEFPGQYGSATQVRTCVKDRFGNWSIDGRPMPEPKQVGERLVCGPVTYNLEWKERDCQNLCKGCGCNLDFVQCWCALDAYEVVQQPIKTNSVGITERCELGEGCRCVKGDEPGCWNWASRVEI